MKLKLIAILLAGSLFPAPVMAKDFCEVIGGAAETVMSGRQNGVSKDFMLGAMTSITNDTHRAMLRHAVEHSFETPIRSTKSAKDTEAKTYGLTYEIACRMAVQELAEGQK